MYEGGGIKRRDFIDSAWVFIRYGRKILSWFRWSHAVTVNDRRVGSEELEHFTASISNIISQIFFYGWFVWLWEFNSWSSPSLQKVNRYDIQICFFMLYIHFFFLVFVTLETCFLIFLSSFSRKIIFQRTEVRSEVIVPDVHGRCSGLLTWSMCLCCLLSCQILSVFVCRNMYY